MTIELGGASLQEGAMDGLTLLEVYVGAEKIWPTIEVVQITLGIGTQARDQFRAALADRGLDPETVTEIPFDIELVGTGSTMYMFDGCSALTTVPPLDTAQVTDMYGMFQGCSALTTVPPLDTAQVTNMGVMFWGCTSLTYVPDLDTVNVTNVYGMFDGCAALTDGNVRLIGRHPSVFIGSMIEGSGLTREPWYTPDGKPIDVYQVSLTDVRGDGTLHPLLTVTVPAGETWSVRIQGTVTRASGATFRPHFRIGTANSGKYGQGEAVDFSGTVTAANSTIAMVTNASSAYSSFVGTVTIEK